MPSPPAGRLSVFTYLVLALLAGAGLFLLYFVFSYLAVTLFLALDHSAYGRLLPTGWPGYALLGLGLGAAGGAVAAQRRYRLHRGLLGGSALVAAALVASVAATLALPAREAAADATEAPVYKPLRGRVSCRACTRILATTTRAPQNDNYYEADNLLLRDSTKAWISATGVDAANPLLLPAELQLAVAPLAGHRLVGLRLRNGYCKNASVYAGFGRAQTISLRLSAGQPLAWTLPDAPHREFFLPLPPASRADSVHLALTIQDSYPGDSHAEVALTWLVPVFEPLKR